LTTIKNVLGKILSFILSHKIYSILVVALLIGSSYYFYQRAHAGGKTTYQTATVAKGMLSSYVSGSGNLIVSNSATINPSVSGTVSRLSVSVGDKVSKGQFLFYINSSDSDTSVAKAYSSYKQALQQVESARTKLLQDQQSLANLSGNSAVLKAASSVQQANQQVESAYASLLQAENDYNVLYAKYQADPTSVTTSELAISAQKIDVAEASYDSAKQALETAQASYNQEIKNVDSNLAIAKQQVAASEASLSAAESSANSALAEYDNQKETSSKRYVTASIAGTITEVNIKNGDEVGSGSSSSSSQSSASSSSTSSSTSSTTGSSSSSSNGSILIENFDSLRATVAINETDIPKVAKDQKATLTVDAITDLTLTGKVTEIAQKGTNNQNVITYDVTLSIDSIDTRLRPEMTVSADITTEIKQDVLYVSSSAIKTDSSGGSFVQIMKNGIPENTNITTGISNDTDTEITSGLNEGDAVVTQTISAGTNNSSSSSSNKSNTGVSIPGLDGGGLGR